MSEHRNLSGTSPEVVPGPSREGSVLLDIGDGQGALVVHTGSRWDGAEIEVRPEGEPWSGQHVAVRRRDVLDRSFFAAVFGGLAPGGYELRPCRSGTGPVLRARVDAGRVAEVRWPELDPGEPLPAAATGSR